MLRQEPGAFPPRKKGCRKNAAAQEIPHKFDNQPALAPFRAPKGCGSFYRSTTARKRASARFVFSHGTPKSSRPIWP